jgi:hypothetical protein
MQRRPVQSGQHATRPKRRGVCARPATALRSPWGALEQARTHARRRRRACTERKFARQKSHSALPPRARSTRHASYARSAVRWSDWPTSNARRARSASARLSRGETKGERYLRGALGCGVGVGGLEKADGSGGTRVLMPGGRRRTGGSARDRRRDGEHGVEALEHRAVPAVACPCCRPAEPSLPRVLRVLKGSVGGARSTLTAPNDLRHSTILGAGSVGPAQWAGSCEA